MLPVTLRIRVDGFGLEPQSELKTFRMNSPGKAFYTSGKLFPVNIIISKTCMVIITRSKPAIIKDEQLASQSFRLSGKRDQL